MAKVLFAKVLYGYGIITLSVALMMWPMFRDPPKDSFPLSGFPMFSRGKEHARYRATHVFVADEQGKELSILPPLMTSGNREVLQAQISMYRRINTTPAARKAYCQEVAARVAEDDDYASASLVVLATSNYDGISYLAGDEKPLSRRIHERCEVKR